MSQWARNNPEEMAAISRLPQNQQSAALRDAAIASLPASVVLPTWFRKKENHEQQSKELGSGEHSPSNHHGSGE
jgi:hypothetical protein